METSLYFDHHDTKAIVLAHLSNSPGSRGVLNASFSFDFAIEREGGDIQRGDPVIER